MLAGAALLLAPGAASASTIGVANLESVPVSGTGILSPPPPYSVWQSGNRDGSTAFYASENGFLTDVSVSHWNNTDVTVKILIWRRAAGNAIQVVQVPITSMVLPMAPSSAPIVTTQTVTGSVPIQTGDRIGLTQTGGTSNLHAIVDNLSPFPAPGVFPTTPPATEPGNGDSYDFGSGSATGPLIRGTVSATPGGGGGGGGTGPGGAPVTSSRPGTAPIKLPVFKNNRVIRTSANCSGLGLRTRCTGTVTVELDYKGNVVGVSKAAGGSNVLGSATYDIPAGTTQEVSIPLNKAGRSKLQKKGKLSAFVVFSEVINGTTVTGGTPFSIKAKKKKKK
jgi:hypothetical protein